jgi:hypothetical protein
MVRYSVRREKPKNYVARCLSLVVIYVKSSNGLLSGNAVESRRNKSVQIFELGQYKFSGQTRMQGFVRILRYRASRYLFYYPIYFQYCKVNFTSQNSAYKNCATNRKVAGSIPDGVTVIFQWLNPSGRIVALGSTASNRNEYQGSFLGVKTAGASGWQPFHLHVPII